jgi:predicted methyltransferase
MHGMSKLRFLGLMVAFGCVAATAADVPGYVVPASAPPYVRHAIESPARSAEDKGRDAARKPAELLVMSEVKPGDRVIEFASFGQYFTTLLSDIVGPKGMIYMYDLPYTEKFSGEASRKFAASHANAKLEFVDYNGLELPAKVDVIFNVLYYHDLAMNKIDVARLNKKIFDALKPGGVFFVVDHNAAAGSGIRDEETLHRIDPQTIRDEVTAAGFKLVTESKLLAHPGDDHTQLTYKGPMKGITDQTIFKFRKPR